MVDGTTANYAKHKERARRRQAILSMEGRDIFPVPKCKNSLLREAVTKSFRRFCEVCFAQTFNLGWSADHIEILERVEKAVRFGDLFAIAMPRGSGKTSIGIAAIIWAVLSGHRRYVVLIGANKTKASKLLKSIKTILETNQILFDLFPEVCYPIRRLEGKGNKAIGQTYQGRQTHIQWTGSSIVFASIPGVKQAAIEVFGLQGEVRGGQFMSTEGETIRPDFFILDDPQTDKSAKNPSQNEAKLNLTNGAVLGMAGPDKTLTGFALVTVIQKDDFADQLLDHKKNPSWQGKRGKMVYQWPTNKDLWEQYADILRESKALGKGYQLCNEFYAKNRAEMDAGAVVGWINRYRPEIGELSAIQCAWNHRIEQKEQFWAEYQNEPNEEFASVELITQDELEAKVNGYPKGIVAHEADFLTAFIDVQGQLLYWAVVAWQSSTFSGWITDFGSWPEQPSKYYSLSKASRRLSDKYKGAGLEGRIRAGLFDLIDHLTQRKFHTIGGTITPLKAIGIDAAWGEVTSTIQSVAIEHQFSSMLMPTFGRGLKAKDKPMEAWIAKAGETKGDNWIVRKNNSGGRHMIIETNFWKSFVHARLNVATGDRGSLSFYRPKMATELKLCSEHILAEYPKSDEANGRKLTIWELPSHKPDNHFFDCISNCAALASACGARLSEFSKTARLVERRKPIPKKKTSLKI